MTKFELFDATEFGYIVYRERVRKGMLQKQLAEKLNVSVQTIVYMEKSNNNITIQPKRLIQLGKILGIKFQICLLRE